MKKHSLLLSVAMCGYTATVPTSSIAPGVWKLGGTLETDAVLVLVVQGSHVNQDVDSQPGYNYFSFNNVGALLHTSKKYHPRFPATHDTPQLIPANYPTLAAAVAAYNAAAY